MFPLKTIPLIAFSILSLTACAPGPDAIAPIPMGGAYAAADCRTAADALARERATLAALENRQRGAAAGDTIGVLLLGLPVSSMTGGDVSGQIAAAKGTVIALESRLSACRS